MRKFCALLLILCEFTEKTLFAQILCTKLADYNFVYMTVRGIWDSDENSWHKCFDEDFHS